MKRTIQKILCRTPALYRNVLRLVGSKNIEKMTLLRLVKNGDVVFDIGANQGDFTVLFAGLVGEKGVVHAFEPVPPTYMNLRRRVAQECPLGNVSINNFGLGDSPGSFPINVPAGDFGQASLRTHNVGSWAKPDREVFSCDIKTLDSYVEETNLKRLDFVKIDVEGAELLALNGSQKTLQELHPVIQFEYYSPWTEGFGYKAENIIALVRSLGYARFYKEDLTPLASVVDEIEAVKISQNIICAVKDIV